MSCEKSAVESDETMFVIMIPDMNGTTLTLNDVYPMYFRPMSGDAETGKGYWFYFKEGGNVKCDKTIALYTSGSHVNGEWKEGEKYLFEPGEAFVPKSNTEYFAWGYSDGHISSEYEYEPRPIANLGFFVISEEEYKIMLEDEYKYGKNYPISNLKVRK
jgi:hypothetical protein